MKDSLLAKTFVTWLVFFNWPSLLLGLGFLWSPLLVLALIPGLIWMNIPMTWLGLAKVVGEEHFDLSSFGYAPMTTFGWLSLFLFWVMVAAVMTGFTILFRSVSTKPEAEVTPDRDAESLARLQESLQR